MKSPDKNIILIVDDEPLASLAEAELLTKNGFEVIAVQSGAEAIQVFEHNSHIGLVLMDIDLGEEMDGTEVARRILNMRDVPVVFLSAHTEPEVVAKTEEITSYGYVVKASGETVLLAAIKMALRLYQTQKELNKKNEELAAANEELQTAIEELESSSEELAETNEALLRSHERLRRAELVSKSGNWEFHMSTRNVFASDGAREVYGIGEGEFTIDGVQKIPLPEYRPMLDAALAGLIGEGRPYDVEFKIRRPDTGEIVDIHSVAEYDPVRNVVFGVIQDITERKRQETILQDREQTIQALINASYDSMYLLKPDGTIEIANEIGASKLGMKQDEALGKNIFVFFEKDVADNRRKMIEEVVRHARFVRFIDHQGGRDYDNSFNPVIDAKGGVVKVAVFARDITQSLELQRMLQESEAKYRAIVEHAGEAIVVASDGKLVFVNPKTEELLGYPREVLYSKPFVEFIHPDDRELVFSNYLKRTRGEAAPSLYEFRVMSSSGEVKHVEIRPVMILWEGKAATLNMLNDITERKKLQSLIKEHMIFLEILLESIPYPVYYKDTEGRYLGCNEAFADFLGIPKDEVVGKTVFDFLSGDAAWLHHRIDMELLHKPGRKQYETQMSTKDGELLFFIFHKATFPTPDGKIGGIIGSIVDITGQKKAEDELRIAIQQADAMRVKAEKLSGEKDILLKEVHHRIKNNLSTIMGLLSMQANTLLNDEAKKAILEARNRVQSMVVLYDKLYATEHFKSMPLSEYLSLLVGELISVYSVADAIKVKMDIAPVEMPAKKLMPLGIIINELITNAFKYAFVEKGHGEISIGAFEKDKKVVLIVSDDGAGIPNEVLEGKRKGFGLELVRLLTKQIKGEMRIERSEGTRFIFEFEKEQ